MLGSISYLLGACRVCISDQGVGMLLRSGQGSSVVQMTSSSRCALDSFSDKFGHVPICTVLYNLMSDHERVWKDGSWFSIYICCRLIQLGELKK